MASRYDDELWELVPPDPRRAPEHLLRFVRALGPAERALDLGCGDGRLTGEIDAAHVIGADVSQVALERSRRRLTGQTVELVELEPDEPLPFDDSAFDLVLCAEMLEHVRDVQLLLSEARRVLRPGGCLAITTPAHSRMDGLDIVVRGFERRFDPLSPHLRFFSRRSLARLLTEMGYELASVRRRNGALLGVAVR